MASTASFLASLLQCKSDIAFYTRQQIFWSQKYEANLAKLQKQVKFEEKWESAFDAAADGSRTTDLKMNGVVYLAKETAGTEAQCKAWADFKVSEYDEELCYELNCKDIDYDTMKTMYDTLLSEKNSEKDSLDQLVSKSAQENEMGGN